MATIKQKLAVEEYSNKYSNFGGSFLYLVRCDSFTKIGVTHNLFNRLNSLQCGCPYEIELLWSVKCADANEVEEILHNYFQEKKHTREWFNLSDDDIEFIKKMVD